MRTAGLSEWIEHPKFGLRVGEGVDDPEEYERQSPVKVSRMKNSPRVKNTWARGILPRTTGNTRTLYKIQLFCLLTGQKPRFRSKFNRHSRFLRLKYSSKGVNCRTNGSSSQNYREFTHIVQCVLLASDQPKAPFVSKFIQHPTVVAFK